MTRLPRTVHLLQRLIEADILAELHGVEVRFEDVPAPELPRLPEPRELLVEASRGTPTKGPQPRRRYPVRR